MKHRRAGGKNQRNMEGNNKMTKEKEGNRREELKKNRARQKQEQKHFRRGCVDGLLEVGWRTEHSKSSHGGVHQEFAITDHVGKDTTRDKQHNEEISTRRESKSKKKTQKRKKRK